eukprot:5300476-Lingulodinium_polyedra.AAC.1
MHCAAWRGATQGGAARRGMAWNNERDRWARIHGRLQLLPRQGRASDIGRRLARLHTRRDD